LKVKVGLKCEIIFLNQHLGLPMLYPILGSNNPGLFRVYVDHLLGFCWPTEIHNLCTNPFSI